MSIGLASTAPVGATGPFGEVRVVDGDKLEMAGEVVHLWGIDAPERNQLCWLDREPWSCGEAAAEALARLIEDAKVFCVGLDVDKAGLVHALCRMQNISINASVVSAGWALDDSRRSGGAYAHLQAEAKAARRGLWIGEFELPWEWRDQVEPAMIKIRLASAWPPPLARLRDDIRVIDSDSFGTATGLLLPWPPLAPHAGSHPLAKGPP